MRYILQNRGWSSLPISNFILGDLTIDDLLGKYGLDFQRGEVDVKAVIISIILVCCVGCSVSIPHGITKDFPRAPDVSNGQNLIVIRESQFVGGGALMQLLVDSTAVAGIASGEYVRLYLEPGLHIISARIFTGRSGYLPIQMPLSP